MLEFNAVPFYRTSLVLASIRVTLKIKEDDIRKENKDGSVDLTAADEPLVIWLIPQVSQLIESLKILGAEITLMSANRLLEGLKEEVTFGYDILTAIDEIEGRLKDELSLSKLLVIEKNRNAYFSESEKLFGPDIERKFRSALFEIDEAAKCYALSRPTACVFHLMRTMEIGIAAVSRCLGMDDPIKPQDRNWGNILKAIYDRIKEKWPTGADRMAGDGAFFEDVYASLDAVRNPWRNATMHVENKYTDDEAEHILIAVKGFMKKLALHFDENGEPKA